MLTFSQAAKKAIQELGYEFVADQLLKINQFNDTLGSRHSVMLVGPTGGGKSVIRDCYCKAQDLMGI